MATKDLSREYLEEAWDAAKKHLPGWAYAMIHEQARQVGGGRARHRPEPEPVLCSKCGLPPSAPEHTGELPKPEDAITIKHELPEGSLPSYGSEGARVLFVGAAPSPLDVARGEPLTGAAGAMFRDTYLRALGLARGDVAITHLTPMALKSGEPTALDQAKWRSWLEAEIKRIKPNVVVALGATAKSALGDLALLSLPHPRAVAKRIAAEGALGDSSAGELVRKFERIRKALTESRSDETAAISKSGDAPIQGAAGDASKASDSGSASSDGEAGDTGREVRIVKALAAEQVVLGVVLDPYIVDAHNDWTPPKEIEATAEQWLQKSRVIGLQHGGKADAYPVQSYTMPYPSERDRELAMLEQPHKVARFKIGNQVVHSGAWLLKTKVPDAKTWADVMSGKITGYSIGGFSTRTKVPATAMPKVEFVDG